LLRGQEVQKSSKLKTKQEVQKSSKLKTKNKKIKNKKNKKEVWYEGTWSTL
jgi:hypothetical protein